MTHIFIVNPTAGRKPAADELRQKLERIEDLDYYVFYTRRAGYESEIVRRVREVFPDEKLRFYSCGGSGTLRNMLNGFTDFENVEIAMYPMGIANDFIHMFPEHLDRFKNMEELIYGDVVMLDYMNTNHGICINHFSTGLDTRVIASTTRERESCLFGRNTPYIVSVLNAVGLSRPREYILTIDGEKQEGSFIQLLFGNGAVIAGNLHFSENPCAADGLGEYLMVPEGELKLPILYAMLHEDFDKIKAKTKCGQWKKARLVAKDGKPIIVNQDGILVHDHARWELQLVPAGLPFVVPKGVTV